MYLFIYYLFYECIKVHLQKDSQKLQINLLLSYMNFTLYYVFAIYIF